MSGVDERIWGCETECEWSEQWFGILLLLWRSIRQQLIGVINRRSLCFFHNFLKRKETCSCKYSFHYCIIKYSQLHIFKCATLLFLTLPFLFICLIWVKKLIKLLMLQRLVLQVSKKYCNLREKNDESR